MPLIGWLNNIVAGLEIPHHCGVIIYAIGLYVDHLWYQIIFLVCTLQIL